jgi:NitT/TauT family transport system permease protein
MNRFWLSPKGRIVNVLLVLLITALVWEAAVRVLGIRAFILPTPSSVIAELVRDPIWYLINTGHTLFETFIGFTLAAVVGVGLAIVVVYVRWIEQTLYTLLVALNSIPKIALAPLFILWLGTGLEPKVAIAFMTAVFPIVISSVLGLRSIDPDMLDLAASLRGSRSQTLWKVRVPNALPGMFAGMKVGISFAFVGTIVGEFVASSEGLGFIIVTSTATFDTARIFAAIILLALTGTTLFYSIEWLERLLLPWHVSQRGETRATRV